MPRRQGQPWPFERWLAPRTMPFVDADTPGRAPLLRATLSAAACCVAAALVAGGMSGAAAGTLIVPIVGTIYGGVAGVVVGGVVGLVYTPVVLAILLVRHRRPTSAYAPLPDLVRASSVLMTLVAIALVVVPLLATANAPIGDFHPLGVAWVGGIVVAAVAVAIRVLRDATVAICRAWTYPWGVPSH